VWGRKYVKRYIDRGLGPKGEEREEKEGGGGGHLDAVLGYLVKKY
jgi:hypothetical protein